MHHNGRGHDARDPVCKAMFLHISVRGTSRSIAPRNSCHFLITHLTSCINSLEALHYCVDIVSGHAEGSGPADQPLRDSEDAANLLKASRTLLIYQTDLKYGKAELSGLQTWESLSHKVSDALEKTASIALYIETSFSSSQSTLWKSPRVL